MLWCFTARNLQLYLFLKLLFLSQVMELNGWCFLDPVHYYCDLHSACPPHSICCAETLQGKVFHAERIVQSPLYHELLVSESLRLDSFVHLKGRLLVSLEQHTIPLIDLPSHSQVLHCLLNSSCNTANCLKISSSWVH